ncbi:MAG: 2-oxo acid dehydrogenase subunit E2, partial [Acidobacteriota bacterium]
MAIELKVPDVGESITEVMVGEWLKKEGDFVEKGEAIVIIETDKVNAELEAPEAGTVSKIHKGDGEDAEVGEVIGLLEAGEAPAGGDGSKAGGADAKEAAGQDGGGAEAQGGASEGGEGGHVMPAAQRAAAERGIDPKTIQGSGPGGRVLKEDVLAAPSGSPSAPASDAPAPKAAEAPRAAAGLREIERVKMTPLRRRVASRLVEAQQNAAMLTTFNEIDMSAVMDLRRRYKQDFIDRHEVKLGFMSFFVKATVEALKQVPQVNAQIDGDEAIYHNYFDIGVAVGGGKGLVVPVIRN